MDLVEKYIRLGLSLNRHLDGLVDAYYGPENWKQQEESGSPQPLSSLIRDAKRLLADIDSGLDVQLDSRRRAWIRGQTLGLYTVARSLNGEAIAYLDEVESCYGVKPEAVSEDDLAAAHRTLEDTLPGSGDVRERMISWRDGHTIPGDKLSAAVAELADDFAERTRAAFGLPDGESIEWIMESNKPWSGFNYYLGNLQSRVAINTDLPMQTLSLGQLVAHESYPGHHTEHCRKEAGLVRVAGHLEESIALIGTPQCLLAEGLADVALEALLGPRPEPYLAEMFASLGLAYDAEGAEQVSNALSSVSKARGNLALMLHVDGRDPNEVIAWAQRWLMLSEERAKKQVEFVSDPTWRAYIFCYTEGVELCRNFVAGDPARFERLLTEQFIPADLATT